MICIQSIIVDDTSVHTKYLQSELWSSHVIWGGADCGHGRCHGSSYRHRSLLGACRTSSFPPSVTLLLALWRQHLLRHHHGHLWRAWPLRFRLSVVHHRQRVAHRRPHPQVVNLCHDLRRDACHGDGGRHVSLWRFSSSTTSAQGPCTLDWRAPKVWPPAAHLKPSRMPCMTSLWRCPRHLPHPWS